MFITYENEESMPPPLFKKQCKRCQKNYLTYEADKEFCNSLCESKHKYEEIFPRNIPLQATKNCAFCNQETLSKFCNLHCKKNYQKQQRTKNSAEVFLRDKDKNKKLLPYHVLNEMAERKRLYQDSWY